MRRPRGVDLERDKTGNPLADALNHQRALRRRHAPLHELARHDDEASAALERRLGAARVSPPAELTLRVESLARRVEAFISDDLFSEQHELKLAPAFDDLAALVAKTWLPGAADPGLADLLMLGETAPRGAPPPRPGRDPQLGYAPLPWPELLSFVRAALFQRPRGERADDAAAAHSFGLLGAWCAAPVVALAPDGNLPLLAAVADAYGRLWKALEVYPPARIYLLARTLAKWGRLTLGGNEIHWAGQGGFLPRRSGFLRAVLAYGTVMLRKLIVPPARPPAAPARSRGAYRAPGSQGVRPAPAADPRLARLHDLGIERSLDAALAHAAVLGALDERDTLGRGDKWTWHAQAFQRMAEQLTDTCARLVMGDVAAVARWGGGLMWSAAWGVGTRSSAIVGQDTVRQAVALVRSALGSILGLQGDLWNLAQAVATALTSGVLPRERGMAALVRALAERLARTPFVAQVAHAASGHQRALHAQDELRRAEAEISLLDRLNVLSDSPAERRKKGAAKVLASTPAQVMADRSLVDQVLHGELRAHPAASVYYALEGPLAHVDALSIGFESSRLGTYAQVTGREPLLQSIDAWMAFAAATFGLGPSPGTLVQDYALGLLADGSAQSSP